jgi:SHAQKYF class myb-like DNA-binding protein
MGYEQDFTRSSSRNASGGRKRRKFSDSAGRSNNKRFVWPDQKHREFVSAVFDVGLKSSTPSLILAAMRSAETFTPEMTTERIKSHLQKFRVHRVKSREEFLRSYEACKKELDEGADRNDGAEPEEGKEGDGRKEGGRGGSFLDDSKGERAQGATKEGGGGSDNCR